MKWFLLSMTIFLMLFILQTASAEEPPTIIFSVSEVIEETHTVFKYEDGMSFIIFWKEDSLNWSIELDNVSLFLNDFSGEGVFPGERGTKSVDYVQLNASAPTGKYNIIIDMTYSQLSGETVTKRYEYPMLYIEPLRITQIILPSNRSYGFTVEVETFVNLSSLTMSFDSDGDIALERNRIELANIPPGNYSFTTKVMLRRNGIISDDIDGGQQEVAYHIIAINGSHTIELYEYNIVVNVLWEEDTNVSITSLYIILITVIILTMIIATSLLYRRRYRTNRNE